MNFTQNLKELSFGWLDDAVEKYFVHEGDLEAIDLAHYEPIQLKADDFVPDFKKSCEENFTREKQMIGAPYSTYPTLVPLADRLEYSDSKLNQHKEVLSEGHAILQMDLKSFDDLMKNDAVAQEQEQVQDSKIRITLVEEDNEEEQAQEPE